MKRLALLLRPYTLRLSLAVLSLIGLAGVNMALPFFLKKLFDDVFPNGNWTLLVLILLGIVAVFISRNVLYFSGKYTAVAVGEHVCFALRNRLFERLQQMNLQFYKRNNPGRISSRVMDDSFVIQSFIQEELPALLQALCMFLFLLAITFAVNWQLAVASTLVLPLHLWAFYYFRGAIKSASRSAQEQLSVVHGNLIEKFLAAEVVKGFTGEERENRAFNRAIDLSRVSQLKSKRYHVTQKVVADLLVGLGTIALLGFGAYQVMGPAQMQRGTFLMFFSYVGMLYPAVLELVSGLAKLTRSTASIDRVFDMLETTGSEPAGQGTTHKPIRGHLAFRDVCFTYGEGGKVLRHINLDIAPGQVCAITGPSGAGKSTVASLVPRFIEPTGGAIELDGLDVREYDLRYLRGAIGMAFQECFLFNSSIRENLQYACPNITLEELIAVAKRTGAHDFISRLPEGYDTLLGESGITLSRGEKQRITLTRAMLKNPKVLILDEATASLDTESESQIIPAIIEFMKGKTTLIITHRPELLRHAHQVVHLMDGEVVYQGSPEEFVSSREAGFSKESDPAAVLAVVGGADSSGVSGKTDELQVPNKARGRGPAQGERRLGTPVWHGLQILAATAAVGLIGAAGSAPVQAQDAPAPAPADAPAAPADDPPAPDSQPLEAPGRFIPLVGLNQYEVEDLLTLVTARLSAEQGYSVTDQPLPTSVMPEPVGLVGVRVLAREEGGDTHLLRLGYRMFTSQPAHLGVYGVVTTLDGQVRPNPDVALIDRYIEEARGLEAQQAQQLSPSELARATVDLSYVEADRALAMLRTFGYQTIHFREAGKSVGKSVVLEPSAPVDLANLPIVIALPGTDSADLVGGDRVQGGAFGLTMTPSVASTLPNLTSGAPLMQLMVLYHPGRPEQYSQLLETVRKVIDRPARQILIEAMVLEVSEQGLLKLGVEWELRETDRHLSSGTAGRLPTFNVRSDEQPTLRLGFIHLLGEFSARVEALIRNGEAEILSRPSVLTLDNRQASIRVGEDVPVAKSVSGLVASDKIGFDFQYLPIGILLNVRPRVSAEGEEVTLQIDGIVSAQVPGQDLVLFDTDGNELARAPRISTRRVQTYGRIRNNTPFIIGGLVSKQDTQVIDKVPLLGDIPILGQLFRSTQIDNQKREVIIVITPFVLPEERVASRILPKDDDAFDSFNNELFRDAYRIRAEDVFDLRFLTGNSQLQRMRALADAIIASRADLAEVYPFDRFVHNRFPGERILVFRQMYEVIKRRAIGTRISSDHLIFFEPDPEKAEGFSVSFLHEYLAAHAGTRPRKDGSEEFLMPEGKALALTYTLRTASQETHDILQQPVPQLQYLDCASSAEWSRLLWQLNQPDEEGQQRYTILLRTADDLLRLKRAVVLKHTVDLNRTQDALSLEHFTIGRQLLMPSIKPEKIYLVDDLTAKYFFYTEQYYPAVAQEIDRDIAALRRELEKPEFSRLLQVGPLMLAPPPAAEPAE